MLKIVFDNRFKKEYKKCLKRGYKAAEFEKVLDLLAREKVLPEKYKDHALANSREYQDVRELHIRPDWLLIYRIEKEDLQILRCMRTGTHSDLFCL